MAEQTLLNITVAAALLPYEVREWTLQLPRGASVADALRACGLDTQGKAFSCGIWGRIVQLEQALREGDRLECCRPLLVDPKVARRQRFARQGARAAGLFATTRAGAKAGY